jgi:hypothetical protein
MKSHPRLLDKMDAYLLRRLPNDERLNFENELAVNPELKAQLETHKQLIQVVRLSTMRMEIREKLKHVESKLSKEGFFKHAHRESSNIANLQNLLLLSLLLFFAVFVYLFYLNRVDYTHMRQKTAFQTFFNPTPHDFTLLLDNLDFAGFANSGSGYQNSLLSALSNYENGDYQQSEIQLSTLLKTFPNNDTLLFYHGLVNLSLNQPANAAVSLAQVAKKDNAPLSDDASWYLALSSLQLPGSKQTIVENLNWLAKQKSSSYHTSATQLRDLLFSK